MVGVRETISTVIVALAVAPVVHADMMPASSPRGGSRWSLSVWGKAVAPPPSDSQASVTFGDTVDLDLCPEGCLPVVKLDAGSTGPAKHLRIVADRQNSLSLCLYALFGLGLCRSGAWIKKLYVELIPDWYHAGGPYQMGHSFAIAPNCLPSTLIRCFIQPDSVIAIEAAPLAFRWEIVASFGQQSQFLPGVVASRGPPHLS